MANGGAGAGAGRYARCGGGGSPPYEWYGRRIWEGEEAEWRGRRTTIVGGVIWESKHLIQSPERCRCRVAVRAPSLPAQAGQH